MNKPPQRCPTRHAQCLSRTALQPCRCGTGQRQSGVASERSRSICQTSRAHATVQRHSRPRKTTTCRRIPANNARWTVQANAQTRLRNRRHTSLPNRACGGCAVCTSGSRSRCSLGAVLERRPAESQGGWPEWPRRSGQRACLCVTPYAANGHMPAIGFAAGRLGPSPCPLQSLGPDTARRSARPSGPIPDDALWIVRVCVCVCVDTGMQ